MPLSGATRVAGIIGWPVDASLSPAIHNAAFTDTGLDWVYVAFPVRPGEAPRAIEGMRALGIAGLNVTMPHKQAVIADLDELTEQARAVNAVNTIAVRDGRLVGDNTDGAGFVRSLERDTGTGPNGMKAVILGAGGAARAIAASLAAAGADVTVAARRPEQAAELTGIANATIAWERRGDAAASAGLVVNATPIGRDGESMPLDGEVLRPDQIVVDLIYHPETTELVRIARERGARAFNGLGMLIHQAALAFEAWTGVPAPLEAMSSAVR